MARSTASKSSTTTRTLGTFARPCSTKLTIEAQQRLGASPLSRREIARRMETSAAQVCRLLDQTNTRKSVDEVLRLLGVLDCEVQVSVRAKSA